MIINPNDLPVSIENSIDPEESLVVDFLNNNMPVINANSFDELAGELNHIVYQVDGLLTAKQRAEELISRNEGRRARNIKQLALFDAVALLFKALPLKHIHSNDSKTMDTEMENLRVYDFFENSLSFGMYIPAKSIIMSMLLSIMKNPSRSVMNDVYQHIVAKAPHVKESNDEFHIPVKNGVFNKQTKELTPFDVNYITMTKIHTDYVPASIEPILQEPDGTPWKITDWMMELANDDKDVYDLFWQILAGTFNPGKSYNKAIIFYSRAGNNGKGTFGDLIKNIIGPDNYSTLKMSEYGKKFQNVRLVGKICNIADENPVNGYLDDLADFKAVVTGDEIPIEQKHQPVYNVVINHLTIQMMNEMPQVRDKTGSFYRRLIVVPFFKSFTGAEKKYIKDTFMRNQSIKEWVLATALEMDVFDTFIEPAVTKSTLYSFKAGNNSVYEFWDDLNDEFQWDALPLKFVYDLYTSWMYKTNRNGTIIGKQHFNKYSIDWLNETKLWSYDENDPRFNSTGNMDNDEPLITQYELKDWYDPGYHGHDIFKRRNFPRSRQYRGFIRNQTTNPKQP